MVTNAITLNVGFTVRGTQQKDVLCCYCWMQIIILLPPTRDYQQMMNQVINALIKIHTISHLLCFALNFVFAID